MRSALGNPFEQRNLEGEPQVRSGDISGLSSAEREVISAIQDGLVDPEAIALNTRLTLAEVKKAAESLKSKGRMAELGTANQSSLGSDPVVKSTAPSNSVSNALRNNSGISSGSSLFVPKSSQGKLRIF
jgi:hypothetical protein